MGAVLNHIGLSGGKDSTALWGWAIHDSGYPRETIRGTFCDTQNEYPQVYEQIAALDAYGRKHGVAPVETLHSEGFLNLCLRKQRFPSAKARFCTEWLKIKPFITWCQQRAAEGFEIVGHSGVRRDESTERSLLDEWGTKQYDTVTVKQRRPLLDWSIEAVWAAHKRYGLPIQPLYFMGRKRVGCRLCCMSSKEDVRLTATHFPATIDNIREWEAQVGAARKHAGMASFFAPTTVPESQRSREYVSPKDDQRYRVATIDDVVRWSFTMRGGVQGGFAFMFEEDDAHLPCQSGWCE